ncbi:MAG: FUSC family membrane protein [Chitinophagaceae bacterium]
MDYFREYKSFVNSYYFAEGLRITVGITLPAVVLNYMGHPDYGLIVALGAMCTSVADLPGPPLARRNGMVATIIINFVVSLLTSFLAPFPIALGIMVPVFCFILSMIGVYGVRVNSIGVAGLLIMVLSLYRVYTGWDILLSASSVAFGGIWYMIFSLTLYNFRPYRLIQQALGDSMFAIADYLRTRAFFYERDADFHHIYLDMMEKQAQVQQKQLLVRELLFKSRSIVKESQPTGRTLLMIFTDSVDLFEKTTTSFHSYEALHLAFDGTGILEKIRRFIDQLATELELNALAVQSGEASRPPDELQRSLQKLQQEFKEFSDVKRSPSTFEGLISLKKIVQSLEDFTSRLYTLHNYTRRDAKVYTDKPVDNYDQFVTRTDLDPKHLIDNLTLRSGTFRHALRLSVAMIVGFILSHLFVLGHSYWILLTILVILKPAYSVSRIRNYQRITGTIAGALLGFAILYFIRDRTALFVIMLVLMTGTYSFLRTQYLISVFLMTPYIFIVFYLLGSQDYDKVIIDRLVDTSIGSAIAFAASILLLPAWEHKQIPAYMSEALTASLAYFRNVAENFAGQPVPLLDYKLSRKDAFVSLGNLSETFSRMLSEPRSKQKNARHMHEFVVMVHMLNSHIAALSHFSASLSEKYHSDDFNQIIAAIIDNLDNAIGMINHLPPEAITEETKPLALNIRVNELINKRKLELQQGLIDTDTRQNLSEFKPIVDQFLFISGITENLEKLCLQFSMQKSLEAEL